MLPDLISLALFVRTVEAGSLSKAAEQSHIALAAASRRIALMEHRYGVKLLYRSSQGVEPTPAGKALVFHARRMLEQAEHLQADLSDYSRGVRGHVRLQASTSVITQYLPRDLAAFAASFPDVKVELEERRSPQIVQAVRDGNADIGIVMEDAALEGLTRYEYRRHHLVAIVPKNHPVRKRSVAFVELLDHDFVGLDGSAAMTRLIAWAATEAGKPLRLRMQVQSFEAVSELVQAGMGIGLLPEAAAAKVVQAMGLRIIRLEDAWAERRMYVCLRDLDSLPVVARKLVEQLVGPALQEAAAVPSR